MAHYNTNTNQHVSVVLLQDLFLCLDVDEHGYFTAEDLYKVTVRLGGNISREETTELVHETRTRETDRINYEGELLI